MFDRLRYCGPSFGLLLIMLVLIAGVASCSPGGTVRYTVNISSTTGGTVTDPGEGVFRYPRGTEVTLVAHAEPGFHFAMWQGNTDTFGDAESATTTVTINNYYFIMANFAEN
jgi:hypothetical protein